MTKSFQFGLDKIADDIKNSGLDGINISIDSLNRETFKKITSHDRLPEILRGIEELQRPEILARDDR